jgi:transposase-like protein
MNSNRSGLRYDREFKNNAIALVRGGRTITEVARDLGVPPSGRWGAAGRGGPTAQRTEHAGFGDA